MSGWSTVTGAKETSSTHNLSVTGRVSLLKIPATSCLLFLEDDESKLSKSRAWRTFSLSILRIYLILRAFFKLPVELIRIQIDRAGEKNVFMKFASPSWFFLTRKVSRLLCNSRQKVGELAKQVNTLCWGTFLRNSSYFAAKVSKNKNCT